jgi:hypothetical protein
MSVQVDVGAGMDAGAITGGVADKELPLGGAGDVEVETVLDLIRVLPTTGEWRDAMPLPMFVEDTIFAIDPLTLLGAFEVNPPPIRVPKGLNRLLGAVYVTWISIRASMPPQVAESAHYLERAFGQQ